MIPNKKGENYTEKKKKLGRIYTILSSPNSGNALPCAGNLLLHGMSDFVDYVCLPMHSEKSSLSIM